MRSLGMIGFGAVYERFASDPDFSDDEVALLHSGEAPFRPLSEPLVHIRALVEHLISIDAVSDDEARRIIAALKQRWFGYRTIDVLQEAVTSCSSKPRNICEHYTSMISSFRIKVKDLSDLLDLHASR